MAEEDYFNFQGHTVDDFFRKKFLSFEIGAEKPSEEIYQPLSTALAASLPTSSSSTIPTSTAMPRARWGCRPAWRLPTMRGSRSLPPMANIFLKRSDAWERHIS